MNMLNIAKWELVKRISKLKVIFPVYIGLLFVATLLAGIGAYGLYNGPLINIVSSLANFTSILIFGVTGYIGAFLPTAAVISDMRSKHFALEKMRGESFVPTVVVRMILSILWVSLTLGLLLLTVTLSDDLHVGLFGLNFGMTSMETIKWLWFYPAILSPAIVTFALIAGQSLRRWKALSLVCAFVLYFTIGVTIVLLVECLSIPTLAELVIDSIAVILLLTAACWLYDNKCEIPDE